jgi:DNA-binding CsgD family transcriptional regulator
MTSMQEILRTIERIYAAVLAPEEWSATLDAIRDMLVSHHTIVISQMTAWPVPSTSSFRHASAQIDTLAEEGGDLIAYAGLDDVQFAHLLSPESGNLLQPIYEAIPINAVTLSTEVVDAREFERSAAYNEVIKPIDGFHFITTRMEAPDLSLHMVSCRRRQAPAFGKEEAEVFRTILPHLATALRFRCHLRKAERRGNALTQLLDRMDIGVILTNAEGKPCFMNERACRILAAEDGLELMATGLAASTPAATRQLREEIAAVGAQHGVCERRLVLPRPSQRSSLILHILPIWRLGVTVPGMRAPQLAVLVKEPDMVTIDKTAIAEIFRLSPRESEVAALLATGLDLSEIAANLGLGLGSVRSYLSRVYEKTEVHHQAALVALIRSAGL